MIPMSVRNATMAKLKAWVKAGRPAHGPEYRALVGLTGSEYEYAAGLMDGFFEGYTAGQERAMEIFDKAFDCATGAVS